MSSGLLSADDMFDIVEAGEEDDDANAADFSDTGKLPR